MAWCISALGREEMAQIAIEEWMAASPIYTRRMQRALRFEGDDVVTIFKGLQLDIGAPPQFMDFRYSVEDPWHGRFELAHCGALMDVEPMGPDYVRSMCHDIEDPTFDATAVATNPRAQVRPVHRPPRTPAGRTPHCEWTVTISDVAPARRLLRRVRRAAVVPGGRRSSWTRSTRRPRAAPTTPGRCVSDLDFAEFSHSALVRIADEVCLQMHLLFLGFRRAVSSRLPADEAREICVKQLTGIAGVAASRFVSALSLPASASRARSACSTLHPLFNPVAYVSTADSPAHLDGAWISLVGPVGAPPAPGDRAGRSTRTSTWSSPARPGPSRSSHDPKPPRSSARSRSPGSAPAPRSPSSPAGPCRSRPSDRLRITWVAGLGSTQRTAATPEARHVMSDTQTSGPVYQVVNPATGTVVETFDYASDEGDRVDTRCRALGVRRVARRAHRGAGQGRQADR